MPESTSQSAVPDSSSLQTVLTDKYNYATRRELIQQPIRDQLLALQDQFLCRIDIRLDVNQKNCTFRESTRVRYDPGKTKVISTRKTQSRQNPQRSIHLAAYRELHSLLFKTLDEMVFKMPANEIPRYRRTVAFSFAEDQSASTKSPRLLHYHCLLFSDQPRTHTFLANPFLRMKFLSHVESRFARRLQGTQFKCAFYRTFRVQMASPSQVDLENSIKYATKFIDDKYLANRHRTDYRQQLQDYADESRLNQMILSTDFLPKSDPIEIKRIRNRNRRRKRSTRTRSSAFTLPVEPNSLNERTSHANTKQL